MAMTYAQSATLMTDPTFVGRVKVACLTFATFVMNEATTAQGHASRLKWAQQTYLNPDGAAQTMTQPAVMDPAVQSAGGAAITDAALQGAVEAVINKMV